MNRTATHRSFSRTRTIRVLPGRRTPLQPFGFGCCLFLGAIFSAAVSPAWAQPAPSSRGADVVDGMVRSLMDSQLPRGNATPASRTASPSNDPAIREIRANMAGFAQELAQLVRVLYQDANRTSGIRSLMGASLQLSAQATMIAQQSARESDLAWFAGEFQSLDQDWRQLAFRLRELRDLSDEARRYVDRTDAYHARLTNSLNLTPQFDRSELIRQATMLSTDLLRLLEEVDIEVADTRTRYELLVEGRRVYQQSRRLAVDTEQAISLDAIRTLYNGFQDQWGVFAAKLRPLQLRYVDRQVQRVHEADRTLRELLMLPAEMDRSGLLHLTDLLQRDLDRLMDGVTLRNLAALNTGRDRIVPYASDFYTACGDFADCVRNGESPETMAELYRYLDSNWQRVAEILKQAEPAEARQVYRQLDRAIEEIRKQLQVQPTVDRDQIGWLAAELENRAINLERDMVSLLSARPNNFPAQFRTQSVAAAQAFRNSARQLNRDAVSAQPLTVLQDRTAQLSQQWATLLTIMDRFPAVDRDQLYQTRQQIAPTLINLQATVVR
jgi:hypothetical protein